MRHLLPILALPILVLLLTSPDLTYQKKAFRLFEAVFPEISWHAKIPMFGKDFGPRRTVWVRMRGSSYNSRLSTGPGSASSSFDDDAPRVPKASNTVSGRLCDNMVMTWPAVRWAAGRHSRWCCALHFPAYPFRATRKRNDAARVRRSRRGGSWQPLRLLERLQGRIHVALVEYLPAVSIYSEARNE